MEKIGIKINNKREKLTTFFYKKNQKKQEAHGPHRSPEKTVQINKHI